MNQQTN